MPAEAIHQKLNTAHFSFDQFQHFLLILDSPLGVYLVFFILIDVGLRLDDALFCTLDFLMVTRIGTF
jgi:hypothetical protein